MSTKNIHKITKNPLLLQSFWSLIARFTGVALNFAVVLIITNQLSKTSAGDILLLMTFVTGVSLISRLGIDQLLMKEVAGSHDSNLDFRKSFLKVSYKAVFYLSLLFILIWVIISPYIQIRFFFESGVPTVSKTEIIVASLGILFFNLVILNSTYLKAIKQSVLGILGQNALTAITFLLFILVFWSHFSNNQYVFYLYTASLVLAGFLTVVFTRHFLTKQYENHHDKPTVVDPQQHQDINLNKLLIPGVYETVKKSIPLAPISIISYLMIFTDTIMVGWFLSNAQVAEYSVASKISYVILFFLQAMEATIYPRLLNIFSHKQSQLQSFFWQSTALVIGVILSVTLSMYLVSDWILLAFGNEYDVAKQALGILLLAQFFRAITITFSFMFIIREKVKYLNLILVTAFITNVVCNIIFIQRYAIEGAAFATLLANVTLLILVALLFYAHRLLSLPSTGAQA